MRERERDTKKEWGDPHMELTSTIHCRLVLCCGKVPLTARHRLREAGIIAVEVSGFFLHPNLCCFRAGFWIPCCVF